MKLLGYVPQTTALEFQVQLETKGQLLQVINKHETKRQLLQVINKHVPSLRWKVLTLNT